MVYRRKRTYGKKRSFRRKTYRRRRMMGRKGRADKGVLEKITRRVPLTVDAGGTTASMQCHWLMTGISGQLDVYFTGGAANASQQFTQCAGMFREYYITSMKVEYDPTHIDAGNAGSYSMQFLQCGTTMDAVTSAAITGSLDFKTYDPKRSFKRFYRVKQYAKQKSLQWRNVQDALTGAAGGFNVLPNCVTLVQMDCQGLAAGTQVGDLTVTWYTRFHHRVRAQN